MSISGGVERVPTGTQTEVDQEAQMSMLSGDSKQEETRRLEHRSHQYRKMDSNGSSAQSDSEKEPAEG